MPFRRILRVQAGELFELRISLDLKEEGHMSLSSEPAGPIRWIFPHQKQMFSCLEAKCQHDCAHHDVRPC